MAKIWRNRIIAGDKLFANCPEKYKNDVLNLLKGDVSSDIISSERFEELTGEKYIGADK